MSDRSNPSPSLARPPSGTWRVPLGAGAILLHKRSALVALGMLGALGVAMLSALMVGTGKLGLIEASATLAGGGTRLQQVLLFSVRLPRVAAVVVAGAALGIAGCLIQTLVRNRLATPDMVGVNEGATLAIVIFSVFLTVGSWPWWAAPLGAAFAASCLVALCRQPGEQGYVFIVIGIGLSELFQALSDFAMSTQSLVHLSSLYLWSMGHFAGQGYHIAAPVSLCLALLLPVVVVISRPLSVLSFGQHTAQGLGIAVGTLQLVVLGLAILIAALGTAIGGPIVFVAMAAPILASRLVANGPVPIWISGVGGALLLLVADTLVRLLASPVEVPTGTMTRFLGGLLLLGLLLRDGRRMD